eukprot:TRINITY_DN51104_c0_g1_i5.p1 TRINITY_DN51104_c0_g1~~TRINITY_DN51104_c0_g1_i5.p1  ORF type:complete len:102 (+),score=6.47 TRINITY_DN51104_c0_g1_i5:43-306(+)
MIASLHESGNLPAFQDWLMISRSFCLAVGPRCLIISFKIPSFPGTFFGLILCMAAFSYVMVKSDSMEGAGFWCFSLSFVSFLTSLIL